MQTIIEKFIFRTKSFSWDSDRYKEYNRDFEFTDIEQLNSFARMFFDLPKPDWDMPYFGDFKDMKDYNNLLEKFGKYEYFSGGGVSTKAKKIYLELTERQIPN